MELYSVMYYIGILTWFSIGFLVAIIVGLANIDRIRSIVRHIENGDRFRVLFNHRHYNTYTGEYLGKKIIMFGWFREEGEDLY